MSQTFLIGDTHFGHKKIIQFESEYRRFSSIEEHDQTLVDNWNSVVSSRDTVWHLGDVLFGKHSFEILGRLNGTKKLVSGNHDSYPTSDYLKYFNKVFGAAQVAGCVLTHIPVHESQFGRYKANIHGHLHSKRLLDPRYICVSAELINLTPVSLEVALAGAGIK